MQAMIQSLLNTVETKISPKEFAGLTARMKDIQDAARTNALAKLATIHRENE
jgi:hypothetical protein